MKKKKIISARNLVSQIVQRILKRKYPAENFNLCTLLCQLSIFIKIGHLGKKLYQLILFVRTIMYVLDEVLCSLWSKQLSACYPCLKL